MMYHIYNYYFSSEQGEQDEEDTFIEGKNTLDAVCNYFRYLYSDGIVTPIPNKGDGWYAVTVNGTLMAESLAVIARERF